MAGGSGSLLPPPAENTTCVRLPSIGLVVTGDAAYNGVRLYLGESDSEKRREWIAALDKIIEDTRQYIRDFDRIVDATTTA